MRITRFSDAIYTVQVVSPERLERGGPLLTVETEVHGGSKSTNEMGPSLFGLLDL
jgi:hypothetical protein